MLVPLGPRQWRGVCGTCGIPFPQVSGGEPAPCGYAATGSRQLRKDRCGATSRAAAPPVRPRERHLRPMRLRTFERNSDLAVVIGFAVSGGIPRTRVPRCVPVLARSHPPARDRRQLTGLVRGESMAASRPAACMLTRLAWVRVISGGDGWRKNGAARAGSPLRPARACSRSARVCSQRRDPQAAPRVSAQGLGARGSSQVDSVVTSRRFGVAGEERGPAASCLPSVTGVSKAPRRAPLLPEGAGRREPVALMSERDRPPPSPRLAR